MLKKGIRYTVHPTLSSLKPDWLVQKHAGAMPAIVHKGVTMTDSMDIAEYLEKSYPHCSLTRHGVYSYQEVLEKTSGFFPALSAFVKNKDATKDAELGDAVEAQLDIIDGILRSTPGYYLCGVELTLADLYLAPQLFHVSPRTHGCWSLWVLTILINRQQRCRHIFLLSPADLMHSL
jgi:glutathione S-transferase